MATAKVGAKKSLFNKPAWASTSKPATEKDNDQIFGQAHLYQEIVQQERERRERNAAKQKEREERDARGNKEPESKRRRISREAIDSDYGSDVEVKSSRSASVISEHESKDNTLVREEETQQSQSTSQRKTRFVDRINTSKSPQTRSQKARSAAQEEAIVLDDDELAEPHDQGSSVPATPRSNPLRAQPKARQPDPESESEEDDEYLRELKAKARQAARSRSLGKENTPAGSPMQPSNVRSLSREPSNAPTSADADEAEVQIWIKTIIPHAKEVIVSRRINQPLDKVKEFWVKRNAIEPGIAERVFFTWNGTRLYNSTTMRGIIERLKRTHPLRDGSNRDPSQGRIVIEAVTEEIYKYRQEQRAKRLAEGGNGHVGGDGDANNENTAAVADQQNDDIEVVQQSKPAGIVIKLRAQGLEEMSLRVRPHTTMRKILSGFCRVREVAPDMQSWLSYDGDRLDEDMTVEEAEFEHDDTVEVYLRPASA